MQGFNADLAREYMLPRLDLKAMGPLQSDAAALIDQAVAADMAYMLKTGVLTQDGHMGDAYYDDDDAFEFILSQIAAQRRTPEKHMDALCAFIDQYMELQEAFLQQQGLLSWD